jgi:hypothetical protein
MDSWAFCSASLKGLGFGEIICRYPKIAKHSPTQKAGEAKIILTVFIESPFETPEYHDFGGSGKEN